MLETHTNDRGRRGVDKPLLRWKVHLVRRHPERLPTMAMILVIGALCVWLLFGHALPVLVALCLLLGSAAEYLLPTRYTIDSDGVTAHSAISHMALSWRDVRRCSADATGVLVTPLPVASRLDRFRGVFLRYAPMGEMGDRASVVAAIANFAPDIDLPDTEKNAPCAEPVRSGASVANEIGVCP